MAADGEALRRDGRAMAEYAKDVLKSIGVEVEDGG
jgi:hypothetical protein